MYIHTIIFLKVLSRALKPFKYYLCLYLLLLSIIDNHMAVNGSNSLIHQRKNTTVLQSSGSTVSEKKSQTYAN